MTVLVFFAALWVWWACRSVERRRRVTRDAEGQMEAWYGGRWR